MYILSIKRTLKKLNCEKANDPIRKWAKDMSQHFTKKDIQMTNIEPS